MDSFYEVPQRPGRNPLGYAHLRGKEVINQATVDDIGSIGLTQTNEFIVLLVKYGLLIFFLV
jgi:hypothetical protein